MGPLYIFYLSSFRIYQLFLHDMLYIHVLGYSQRHRKKSKREYQEKIFHRNPHGLGFPKNIHSVKYKIVTKINKIKIKPYPDSIRKNIADFLYDTRKEFELKSDAVMS